MLTVKRPPATAGSQRLTGRDDAGATHPEAAGGAGTRPSRGGKANVPTSILIVDDEPIIRDVLARVLDLAGYQVRTAESGVQALSLLREQVSDLVMLDVRLPGADGWEILAEIRDQCPDLRVIMMSAVPDAERARAAGAADFLGKPYRREEVLAMIAAVLAGDAPGDRHE